MSEPKPKQDQYQCAACGGIFDKVRNEDWSDEKAAAERDELFQGETEFDIVCDTCFNKMKPYFHGRN